MERFHKTTGCHNDDPSTNSAQRLMMQGPRCFPPAPRPAIFSALQECLKQAIPDYLARGTDLFPLKPVKEKNYNSSPNWCGSVGWVSPCKREGHWFNSQSGHMSGSRARSPVGGRPETTHSCFSPLSPSLSLKINKQKLFKN